MADAIEEYLKELVLTTDDTSEVIVRISTIGAILSQLRNLIDYNNLRLNGDTRNITSGENDVPVLGEVRIE